MECVHQALKNSSEETVAKPTDAQQMFSDDFWSNGQGVVDDFFVDNLLDFSEAPVLDEEQHNEEYIKEDKKVVLQHEPAVEPAVKVEGLAGSIVAGSDLCFPVISPLFPRIACC